MLLSCFCYYQYYIGISIYVISILVLFTNVHVIDIIDIHVVIFTHVIIIVNVYVISFLFFYAIVMLTLML